MTSEILIAGVLIGGLLLFFFFAVRYGKKQGAAEAVETANKSADEYNRAQNEKNEAVAQQNAEIVEEVERTHEIHDRLDSDPAYRDRVRERFSRD